MFTVICRLFGVSYNMFNVLLYLFDNIVFKEILLKNKLKFSQLKPLKQILIQVI